jgi:dTDP-6-deoxy-L-talose 4-dehydrogenase (NAD+)
MKILVTGGTGFIGNHIVNALLAKNHNLIVTGTNIEKAAKLNWYKNVQFETLDLDLIDDGFYQKCNGVDKVIHLVWSGLPHYKDLFHFENNLMPQYLFIKRLVMSGIHDVTITGTCFEYGKKCGPLTADMDTDPTNPYALAKDTLRKFLEEFQKLHPFNLKWLRLFYMYGEGQAESSILSQLEKAIKNGDSQFNMSGGEQLRDYQPVEKVVQQIINISLNYNYSCIANCASGVPISIRSLVENYVKKRNSNILLNIGHYPYPDYEPMAFWGDISKINQK